MKQIFVLATNNSHKVKEIKKILADFPVNIKSLSDYEPLAPLEETGTTYAANALLKAQTITKAFGIPALADDSGIEIEALQGAPGVESSRYLGEFMPYETKNQHILNLLKNLPAEKRKAKFVCAAVATFPNGRMQIAQGEIHGIISEAPRGKHGFGYDPIFFLPELGKTIAELSPEEKNKISHRSQAFRKLFENLLAA